MDFSEDAPIMIFSPPAPSFSTDDVQPGHLLITCRFIMISVLICHVETLAQKDEFVFALLKRHQIIIALEILIRDFAITILG